MVETNITRYPNVIHKDIYYTMILITTYIKKLDVILELEKLKSILIPIKQW